MELKRTMETEDWGVWVKPSLSEIRDESDAVIGARSPELYLYEVEEEHLDVAIYLVNASERVLDEVVVDMGGGVTIDDEAVAMEGNSYRYETVLPDEAVKVDQYTQYYDEGVFQLDICVKDAKGVSDYRHHYLPAKRGNKPPVLTWKEELFQ